MMKPFYLDPQDPPSKQAMLTHALRLFVHKGLCETTVRDIADAAGYTNPALFKFFKSKEALALYLFRQCYAELHRCLTTAIKDADRFEDKIHAVVYAYVVLVKENPEAVLYVHEHLREFWPKVSRSLGGKSIMGMLRALLQEGVNEKKVTNKIPLEILMTGFSGLLPQFSRLVYFGELVGDPLDWGASLEETINRMLRP